MLDIIFIIFILLAVITILLAIYLREEDAYWNILFIVVSAGLWFILALFTTSGIETPYTAYNSTVGNSSMYYSVYAPAEFVYLSYFFGLMGVLCMIYLIVTIFGYYYEKLDKQNREREREAQDE
jgi:4-amino-4-deoxy-L-arabinose transferase-like glycosyltransferase